MRKILIIIGALLLAILIVLGSCAPTPPAAFTTGSLSISPTEVNIGEWVIISVLVTNVGEEEGSYSITLKVNGEVEETEEIALAGGASETVTFTTNKDEAGTYSVDVDGLIGSFMVTATPMPPIVPPGPSDITIVFPQEKSEVSWHYPLEGKSPEVIPGSGLNVYLLVYPIESNGPWWVQPPVELQPDGSWETYAYFGRDPMNYPEDIGDQFYVIAIATELRLEPGQQWHFLPDFEYKSDLVQVRRE